MVFCSKCGKENEEKEDNCLKCGTKLERSEVNEFLAKKEVEEFNEQPIVKNSWVITKLVKAVLITIVSGMIIWTLVSNYLNQ